VTLLQQYLVAKGVLSIPAGTSYGYFGPLTKFALAKFQQQNGISPAVGFFGPVTKAKIKTLP
jgi:peptidoglycan hydrolase-like protein with peptidoglycan-binding domain